MTKIRVLADRLERISGGGDVWIPGWLSTVGSDMEIAEWKAISRAYHGLDRRDRVREFIRAMRRKHPDMPLTFEEQMEEGVRKLKDDKDLARREGLTEEDMQD